MPPGRPTISAGAAALHEDALAVEGHAHTINAVLAQSLSPAAVRAIVGENWMRALDTARSGR